MHQQSLHTFLAVLLSSAGCCKQGNGNLTPAAGNGVALGLSFGDVPVNVAKVLPLVLGNTGEASLTITGSSIGGPAAADFSFQGQLSGSIASGGQQSVNVQFIPSAAGVWQATATLTTDSSLTPTIAVSLTGIGLNVAVVIAPPALDFGTVEVEAQKTLPLTFTDTGQASGQLQFLPITGPQAADFSTPSQGGPVSVGQPLVVQVTYQPHAAGASTASLPYALCQGCAPQMVALLGQGAQGTLVFAPSPVAFGNVPSVGSSQTVTGTNTGNVAITVASLATQSGGANGFTVSGFPAGFPATPLQLQPQASFELSVKFTAPQTGGGVTDNLTGLYWVTSPASPQATLDVLTATQVPDACALSAEPTSVGFNLVTPPTSATRTVTVSNGGQSACSISAIALAPGSDPWFSIQAGTALTSVTVTAGQSISVPVIFTPTGSQAPLLRDGTLTIASNDPLNPLISVPLSAVIGNYAASSWPKWHHDNGNTGLTAADTSTDTGALSWKAAIGLPTRAADALGAVADETYLDGPAVGTDGTIYQLGLDGFLHAFSPDGGAVWLASVPVTDPGFTVSANGACSPTVGADDTIYEVTDVSASGSTYFHLGSDGGLIASYKLPIPPHFFGFSTPVVFSPNGEVLLSDAYHQMIQPMLADSPLPEQPYCLPDAGSCLPINSFSPAVADDGSSYWSGLGLVYAVSPTGTPLWMVIPQPGIIAPGGAYYITSLSAPALQNGVLYVALVSDGYPYGSSTPGNGGGLWALNPATGTSLWSYEFPNVANTVNPTLGPAYIGYSSPAILADNGIVVGYADGVYCVDAPDGGFSGTLRWKVPVASPQSAAVASSAAIGTGGAAGTVFIGTESGALLSIDASTGNVNWTYQLPARASDGLPAAINSSPAIGPDGTIYFAADDGNLYAVH